MMNKVDVETIAKDLVIMIGEQGHTEEGVVKYLNQYLTRQPVQGDEDCPSKKACVYYLPGTLKPNCLYIGVDELIETYKYPMSGKSDPASIAEDLERFAKELLTRQPMQRYGELIDKILELATRWAEELLEGRKLTINLAYELKQLLTQKQKEEQ